MRALMRALRLPATSARPIVEPTPLFVRGLGEVTDIVEKEMYSLTDAHERRRADAAPRGHGRRRARGDRAQRCSTTAASACTTSARCSATSGRSAGRYRQFHQVGVEALGFAGPDVDAEVILMCAQPVARPGPGATCGWSSTAWASRPSARAHRAALVAHFEAPRRPARRRGAAPPAQQPAAHPGHQEPGDAGRWWRRRRS